MGSRVFTVFIILNLVIVDAFIGFSIFRMLGESRANEESGFVSTSSELPIIDNSSCSPTCISYIDNKVADITPIQETTIVEKEVVVTTVPQQTVSTSKKTKTVSYIPIPGSGNTLETDWDDLEGTDIYLSKVDYPGLIEVYFEANMKLMNGNGVGYLRIYDVTNGRAVDGSTIETSSQTSVFVSSGQVSLWEGYNHYIIQARSLTADTTIFESGRLKMILEN